MTETHSADSGPDESESIQAAKRGAEHADREVTRSRADAEAAQRGTEQGAEVLAAKEREVAEVRTEFEAVGQRLSMLPLDDPSSEATGGRHRHLELVLKRLEGECGSLQGALAAAQERTNHLRQRAEMCEAIARNAAHWTELQRLREAFPVLLDRVLAVIRDHRTVLGAADEESAAYNLSRLGRGRLFLRRDQLRQDDMDELALILTRHSSGLALVPSGALSAFTLEQDGNGDGEPPPGEQVEPEFPGEPAMMDDGEPDPRWVDAILQDSASMVGEAPDE